VKVYGAPNAAQARTQIERSDAMRGKFVAQMTGLEWLMAENYHLCLDTSTLPLPEISGVIATFVRQMLASS
jgi:hypothetical protein